MAQSLIFNHTKTQQSFPVNRDDVVVLLPKVGDKPGRTFVDNDKISKLKKQISMPVPGNGKNGFSYDGKEIKTRKEDSFFTRMLNSGKISIHKGGNESVEEEKSQKKAGKKKVEKEVTETSTVTL